MSEWKEARDKAHREICDLAQGKRKWEMCIPPQKTDSDMVLQNALDVADKELDKAMIRNQSMHNHLHFAEGFLKVHDKKLWQDGCPYCKSQESK